MIKIKTISDLGLAIKKKRKEKKLSQKELAEICGVGRRFLSELESGKKENFDLSLAFRVLKRLGFELYLFGREEEVSIE
jgi:transcriptional regulator with XRE-family HTH domain